MLRCKRQTAAPASLDEPSAGGPANPCAASNQASDCISISLETVRLNANATSPVWAL
jgi:hypothetical protein